MLLFMVISNSLAARWKFLSPNYNSPILACARLLTKALVGLTSKLAYLINLEVM